MEFVSMEKMPRLFREITITEKIDGGNAVIGIGEDGSFNVGTRTQWIDKGRDFHGLRDWAYDNKESLIEDLGVGLHRGEWYGKKIGRGYDLDHNRFALFNTHRWDKAEFNTENLGCVPLLWSGRFTSTAVLMTMIDLNEKGSQMVPGYMRPEGLCIYHTQANMYFKVMCENDHLAKGQLKSD
ncbi:hypothetical protein FDI69_gp028 [Rhodococcus phage Trina]|uniref:RNA ligase n=1 Tax=Rhodococcus phage Trina TaxID=2027905 RepID=A0A2D0ZM50_9CAUD|nr:hypothetical protein FDI69_gp028 [Rhodococcus phage Trina]ASZ74845.1 RNA ligase [Rhodococcus phage Trina]